MTDAAMIEQTARVLFPERTVTELRVIDTPRHGTVSGYFDDHTALVRAARQWSGKAPAVYATLNPCQPALLARAANRLKERARATTSDGDILRRVWFPLDFDPVRPAGVSSTEEEHAAALARAEACTTWLTSRGWPQPVVADSGNGGHLLYPIDLPNTEESRQLVQHGLDAIALFFTDHVVSLDVSVFNAARIWKLYGTMACKGDHLPERPHRLSTLLSVPQTRTCVTEEQLVDLAALLPTPTQTPPPRGPAGAAFNLAHWIATHRVPVASEGPWQQSGHKWVLNPCPWNPDHTNKAALLSSTAVALLLQAVTTMGVRGMTGTRCVISTSPAGSSAERDQPRMPSTGPMGSTRSRSHVSTRYASRGARSSPHSMRRSCMSSSQSFPPDARCLPANPRTAKACWSTTSAWQ